MTADSPDFLDLEDVLELHALQVARYGGADGVRDRGLLESAVAQPQATFDEIGLENAMADNPALLEPLATPIVRRFENSGSRRRS